MWLEFGIGHNLVKPAQQECSAWVQENSQQLHDLQNDSAAGWCQEHDTKL